MRIKRPLSTLLAVITVVGLVAAAYGLTAGRQSRLAVALSEQNPQKIKAAVAARVSKLGEQAGLPEVEDQYQTVPEGSRWLTPAEAQVGFSVHHEHLEKRSWWRTEALAKNDRKALRMPASVLGGCVAAVRAGLDGADRSLAMARAAADYLIRAQEEAGTGLYPFPAVEGTSNNKAMEAAQQFLQQAARDGKLHEVVRNGWIIHDAADGSLQFDNGECGVAMLEYHELTRDPRYLESARKAATWAAGRSLSSNWNYNSFSVWLLAKMHAVTRAPEDLSAAKRKALLGVIPGQLAAGPRAGRWADAHNARPAYHYIMLRSLAELISVLPPEDPDRGEILNSLKLGLLARNREMATTGIMNKDKAMETLLLVEKVFAHDRVFLGETFSTEALNTLGRGISHDFLTGNLPLSPREWSLFLGRVKKGNP